MSENKIVSDLARGQDGIVARWQCEGLGISRASYRAAVAGWREPHDGVYVSGHGRITEHQRLLIGSLTTPDSAVAHESAGLFYGLRKKDRGAVSLVRPGSGGPFVVASPLPRRAEHAHLDLWVRRSTAWPKGDIVVNDGIRMMSPERTVLDLVGLTPFADAQDRLVRDALRTKLVTPQGLREVVARNTGRRGCGRLRALNDRYALLPLDDARSDAEAQALRVLAEAGVPLPQLNVLVVGLEGDLVWVAERFIIELDSRQYHPFPSVDEHKQRTWEAAGWGVERLPVNVSEDSPSLLIETARRGISMEAVAARVRRHAA